MHPPPEVPPCPAAASEDFLRHLWIALGALLCPAQLLPTVTACVTCGLPWDRCLQEYEEWKSRMLAEEKNTCSSSSGKKAQQLTEKKLRQATLSFAAPAPAEAQAAAAEVAVGGAAQGVAANGSKQPPKTQEAASCSKGKASGRKAAGTGKQLGKSNE